MDWFQIGEGIRQGCILSPCLFNLYAEYITQNARMDEAQTWIKIAERNINNLSYAYDTTLMTESEEELKNILMNEKEWKSWFQIQHLKNEDHGLPSHYFMANRWGNNGTVTDFILGGSKITAAMKLKDTWSLQEKLSQPRQYVKKPRHYFANKGLCHQSYGFPIFMYRCESWTTKKV